MQKVFILLYSNVANLLLVVIVPTWLVAAHTDVHLYLEKAALDYSVSKPLLDYQTTHIILIATPLPPISEFVRKSIPI